MIDEVGKAQLRRGRKGRQDKDLLSDLHISFGTLNIANALLDNRTKEGVFALYAPRTPVPLLEYSELENQDVKICLDDKIRLIATTCSDIESYLVTRGVRETYKHCSNYSKYRLVGILYAGVGRKVEMPESHKELIAKIRDQNSFSITDKVSMDNIEILNDEFGINYLYANGRGIVSSNSDILSDVKNVVVYRPRFGFHHAVYVYLDISSRASTALAAYSISLGARRSTYQEPIAVHALPTLPRKQEFGLNKMDKIMRFERQKNIPGWDQGE